MRQINIGTGKSKKYDERGKFIIVSQKEYERVKNENDVAEHELELLRSRLEYFLDDYEPDPETYPEEDNIMDDLWMYFNEPGNWFELNEK